MASGQPSGLTRMLQPTIATASSERDDLEPGDRRAPGAKAIASSGAGSSDVHRASRQRSAPWRELDEDLVGLDHAQLVARLLLDHLEAFLQVAHFGGELLVALLRLRRWPPSASSSLLLQLDHVAARRPGRTTAAHCTSTSSSDEDER